MSLWRPAGPLGVVVLLVALSGCGGDGMSDVKGNVTFDNVPVEKGFINFIPADGKGATAGAPISGGRYAARAPNGVMKVWISMPKVVGTKKLYATADSPSMPVTAEALPRKYSDKDATMLQMEVAGSTEKDFALSSK